jgi:anaerobic dimethyl sulfoxide reductase subunit B (iron-sulfur subunit)/Tat-targeted selenate reductase subunit YnfG
MACPYHAPFIDQVLKTSSKCDGCRTRVGESKNPICVDACPLRALEFGEMSELQSKHPGSASSVLPLPDAQYTQPNLLIKGSDAARRAGELAGAIANPSEI